LTASRFGLPQCARAAANRGAAIKQPERANRRMDTDELNREKQNDTVIVQKRA
jgi:hypothetical protein